jgi:hypothetical protein
VQVRDERLPMFQHRHYESDIGIKEMGQPLRR